MSGKYREGLKAAGKVGPLGRKVSVLAREVRELTETVKAVIEARTNDQARAQAAADLRAADPMLLFVTRAELVEVLDSGELPEAWVQAPEDPETPGAADEDAGNVGNDS